MLPQASGRQESAVQVAYILYQDNQLSEYVYRKKKLPIKSY